MVYNKSDALLQEYQRVGEAYEDTELDKYWDFIQKQIQNDPGKKETIQSLTRIEVSKGEEYIVYIHSWEGLNPIGSFIRATQTDVGIYPRFEPVYQRYLQEDNTYAQKLISKNTVTAYYIPFNKETAEKLHKLCDDKSSKSTIRTKYYVQPEGGTAVTVDSYNDWVNGDFDDIFQHGKISTIIPQTKKQ